MLEWWVGSGGPLHYGTHLCLLFEPGGWSLGLGLLLCLLCNSSLVLLAVLGLLAGGSIEQLDGLCWAAGSCGQLGLHAGCCLLARICISCGWFCIVLPVSAPAYSLVAFCIMHTCISLPGSRIRTSPLVLGQVPPFSMGRALSGV